MPKCPSDKTWNSTLKACRDKKKPGRKLGTKKAAPKPKVATPKPASPSLKHIKFEFSVYLKSDRNMNPESYKEDIINWYKGFAADLLFDDMKLSHVKDDVFSGDFKEHLEEGPPWYGGKGDIDSFVDPDDDGNYPLKIGRSRSLVIGKLLSINGVEVKN